MLNKDFTSMKQPYFGFMMPTRTRLLVLLSVLSSQLLPPLHHRSVLHTLTKCTPFLLLSECDSSQGFFYFLLSLLFLMHCTAFVLIDPLASCRPRFNAARWEEFIRRNLITANSAVFTFAADPLPCSFVHFKVYLFWCVKHISGSLSLTRRNCSPLASQEAALILEN